MMRVLFITGEFPPMQGGVGDCTNEIALALAKRGVHVSILTTDVPDSVLSPPSLVLTIFRTIKQWNWSALLQIRRTIANTQADIVHIQYQTGAFGMHPMVNFAPRFISTAPRRSGDGRVKRIVTFHDLRPMYLFPKAGRIRDWVTFQLARGCDAVIATNEQDYAALDTLRLQDLSLIPIGSNIEASPLPGFRRDALRAKLGVRPDEILLCYFGFLNESKGAETLIRALADIPNAKLVMLGGQTGASDMTNVAFLERVKREIGDWRLEPRVIWTDFMPQADISAHFFASDICVLPYRDGATYRRGTLMAALAHGMAIITTKTEGGRMKDETPGRVSPSSFILHPSSLPSLRDGENVLLVPPDDPQAIARAVKQLASSPELQTKLQQGARATAQFFTWDKIADAHLALYQKLLS